MDGAHSEYVVELVRDFGPASATPPMSKKVLRQIPYLRTLRKLDLSDTGVDDGAIKDLVPSLCLQRLALNNTKIEGSGLKHVHPHSVKELNLSNTKFHGNWLRAFTNLQVLNLSSSSFSNADVDSLMDMESLRWLYIDGTAVDVDGIAALSRLKGLRLLYLDRSLEGSIPVTTLAEENARLKIRFVSTAKVGR